MSTILDDFAGGVTEDDIMAGAEFEDNGERPPDPNPAPRRGGRRTRERQCEDCQKTFTGGTKKCPDCRGSSPRAPRASSPKLEDELLEGWVSLASDLAVAMPTLSGVLILRAESSVKGMVSLSKGHPRVQAILQKAGKASQAADLFQTVILAIVATMVDIGRIPAEHFLLDTLAVVELERDDRGKPVKDGQGKYLKNRTTLRDIYTNMHPDAQPEYEQYQQPGMAGMPPFSANGFMPHDTGTRPPFIPPMNWTGAA